MVNEHTAHDEMHVVIDKWLKRVTVSQCTHYDAGNYYEKFFLSLGVLVVVLSAAVGSAEVLVSSARVAELGPEKVKAISGLISLFIAILAGLQTFLKFSQKAERHRVAGAKYGDIRRSLEELDILTTGTDTEEKQELHEVKKKMDSLALESPELPYRVVAKHGGTDA
jgi:hypothetical protein